MVLHWRWSSLGTSSPGQWSRHQAPGVQTALPIFSNARWSLCASSNLGYIIIVVLATWEEIQASADMACEVLFLWSPVRERHLSVILYCMYPSVMFVLQTEFNLRAVLFFYSKIQAKRYFQLLWTAVQIYSRWEDSLINLEMLTLLTTLSSLAWIW